MTKKDFNLSRKGWRVLPKPWRILSAWLYCKCWQVANVVITEICRTYCPLRRTPLQHLRELKDAGLIQGEITPLTVKYCIDPAGWKEAKHLFSSFFAHLPTKETDSGKQEEVGDGME